MWFVLRVRGNPPSRGAPAPGRPILTAESHADHAAARLETDRATIASIAEARSPSAAPTRHTRAGDISSRGEQATVTEQIGWAFLEPGQSTRRFVVQRFSWL